MMRGHACVKPESGCGAFSGCGQHLSQPCEFGQELLDLGRTSHHSQTEREDDVLQAGGGKGRQAFEDFLGVAGEVVVRQELEGNPGREGAQLLYVEIVHDHVDEAPAVRPSRVFDAVVLPSLTLDEQGGELREGFALEELGQLVPGFSEEDRPEESACRSGAPRRLRMLCHDVAPGGVVRQAGSQPSAYWPVSRSMRGPCPATQSLGLPIALSSGTPMRPGPPWGMRPVSSRQRSSARNSSQRPTGLSKG